MTPFSTLFIAAIGLLLSGCLAASITDPSAHGDLKDSGANNLAQIENDDLVASAKQSTTLLRGAFILCENRGGKIEAKVFTTRKATKFFIFPRVTPTCTSVFVSGTVGSNTRFNHEDLWGLAVPQTFTSLDFYNERLFSCTNGKISIIRRKGTKEKVLYECGGSFEAHVVTFGA